MARHELPLDRRLLHGHFSRELEPVVTIDPGDSVRLSVPNVCWRLESGVRRELVDGRKELGAGTTLFLPIPVDGALFSAGDGHAAQGVHAVLRDDAVR